VTNWLTFELTIFNKLIGGGKKYSFVKTFFDLEK
jgi:hypothetical protein